MARPLSEDKRNAILRSAAQAIAEVGISAPTSRIAKDAGVAEGTIFTYFTNKDELFSQLYQELKKEVAEEIMSNFPIGEDISIKVRHVWMAYVDWAMNNIDKRNAMQQLGVSNHVSSEARRKTRKLLQEVDGVLQKLINHKHGLSAEFVSAVMSSLAETTVEFMISNPVNAKNFAEIGFGMFWRAVTAE